MNPLTIFAQRFVAGERPQDAVRAGERLHAKGIKATFDKLGEDVLDQEAARRATEAAKDLLRLIPAGIERNISIKMSSMGQEISRDLCLENVGGILDVAREVGGFVRLDMEGSKLTQDTIEIFHALRKRHDNVGIVLQAYLRRTPDDVKEAVRRGDRVRLCKGAYREPAAVALSDMGEIREAFKACAHALLDGGQLPGDRDPRRGARRRHDRVRGRPEDRGLPLRVPDALRPAQEPLGGARPRRLERAHLRPLRHALDPLLLPPAARAEGERALRAQEPVPLRAVVYRGQGRIAVEEVPLPEPAAGQMLVRVDACGICPTDLKKIEKGLLPGPRIFGHEIAGTVAALGPGTRGFREGQRVVVHHHVPCGTCFYCARKAYAQCAFYKKNGTTAGFEPSGGGYAEYVLAFDWIVERGTLAIPDGVLPEEAAFVEPVNTCLKAVRKAGVSKGESVLVVGQGPIGLLLMQLARWAGGEVVVSDPLAERRALALSLGAREALDATDEVPAQVRALTQGRGADCTLVAATGRTAFGQALDATRSGGRILSFAATSRGETAEVDLGLLTTAEKDILTAYSSSIEGQQLAADLVFDRTVRVRELVSHCLPMERAVEAFALAQEPGPGTLKVVLTAGAGR